MKKTFGSIILGLCLFLMLFGTASAQVGSLTGAVVNQQDHPIPGLTVYLVHPEAGRSSPSITDSSGRFYFYNVPLRKDLYYIEIYWGRDLIYRQSIPIRGNENIRDIRL